MLHLLTASPYSSQSLQTCLRYSSHEDAIILLQDAVYAVLSETESAQQLAKRAGSIYLLEADMNARGLAHRIEGWVRVINHAEFVALTAHHNQQISWK